MERLVIIPTYNERENIEAIITTVMELPILFNVLVIDDGSPDGTAEIVKRMMNGKYKGCIHLIEREGKHYLKVNDYEGLRRLYGELLAEIQRITSEGDYAAAKEMVEKYAVKVNPELHQEILARYKKLNLAPYKGFVNPVYTAVRDAEGNITDVKIDFSEGYVEQHLRYSKDYSPLPDVN